MELDNSGSHSFFAFYCTIEVEAFQRALKKCEYIFQVVAVQRAALQYKFFLFVLRHYPSEIVWKRTVDIESQKQHSSFWNYTHLHVDDDTRQTTDTL